MAVISSYKLSSLAEKLKKEIDIDDSLLFLETSPENIEKIINSVKQKFASTTNSKTLATFTNDLWERITSKPPKILASIMLMLPYFLSLIFLIISFFVIVLLVGHKSNINRVININNKQELIESTYLAGVLNSEIELNSNNVYHGEANYYSNGKIIKKGFWKNGKRDGTWLNYNEKGSLINKDTFENDKFLYREKRSNFGWKITFFDELSADDQKQINDGGKEKTSKAISY